MKVLLDTHTFLWWIANDSQLSEHARSVIEDASQFDADHWVIRLA